MITDTFPPKVNRLHPCRSTLISGFSFAFLLAFSPVHLRAQVCNDLSFVSLDETCTLVVTPDMVLESNSINCIVSLHTLAGVPIPNQLNAGNLGQTLVAVITDTITGNSCQGQIRIEDHLAPNITCQDIQVVCGLTDYSPNFLASTLNQANAFPATLDNCGSVNLIHTDTWTDLSCSDPMGRSAVITRYWTARDPSNNQNNCQQNIHILRKNAQDVLFPPDAVTPCSAPVIKPESTGKPFFFAGTYKVYLFPDAEACDLTVAYADQTLPYCAGAYKILRSWSVQDGCTDTLIQHLQVIDVADNAGPLMNCPPSTVVNANPQTCSGDVDFPDVILSDNCSPVLSITAKWSAGGTNYTLPGTLADFPGNNHWINDTLGVLDLVEELPIGTHTIYYIASDQCGKQSSCSFSLTIRDSVPPVAVCQDYTQVNISGNGQALVWASTFNDGSYDNCAVTPALKVRRKNTNDCQATDHFYDAVRFCCADVGDTVSVILRVYDLHVDTGAVDLNFGYPHFNDCEVVVLVKDKLKPVCLAPPEITVSCEDFDPELEQFGAVQGVDNCCLNSVIELPADYTQFDTICNKGTLIRKFQVEDCYGLSSQCTQKVVVNYNQFYYIRFPDDLFISDCDTTGFYSPGPQIFNQNCERISISSTDQYYESAPEACVKIERTWKIINWCTYNPNLPLITVPNPSPFSEINNPGNLPGPLVAPPGNNPPSTISKIFPSDIALTNFSDFWFADANGYEYKQIINIRDVIPPKIRSCPLIFPLTFCDYSTNDPQLWNKHYWSNVTMPGVQDLCEGNVELAVTAEDACTGADVSIRYLLFLDLDGDDSTETVISSTNLPGYNQIRYGNANTPDFMGGELREFDQRPVPPDQKYGFAIQYTMFGFKTARLRWNTQANPTQYVSPQLPYGSHKIRWIVTDACGNETYCEYHMKVRDCLKPSIVCLNGISVNVQINGQVAIYPSDLIVYADDNCTPGSMLDFGIIASDQSTGAFPLDAFGMPQQQVLFDCSKIGTQNVQLWVRDLAGNTGSCETFVDVQDNLGMCTNGPVTVSGALQTEALDGVEDAQVSLSATAPFAPPIAASTLSDNQGNYSFPNAIPYSADYSVTPYKNDNPLNGVTTYDLVRINEHLLGNDPLPTPYKMIAADANNSNSITTLDIIILRKLILGIYSELPASTSWRFIDRDFTFPNPWNPFESPFPESINVEDNQISPTSDNFVAVKVGDVNGSALPNDNFLSEDDRYSDPLLFAVSDVYLEAGVDHWVELRTEQPALAFQFTLSALDGEISAIQAGNAMEDDHFALFNDAVTVAWASSSGKAEYASFRILIRPKNTGWLREKLQLSGRITPCISYRTIENGPANIELRFKGPDGQSITSRPVFELYQNIPNPLVHKTAIAFYLPEDAFAEIVFLDQTGKEIFRRKGDFKSGNNTVWVDRGQFPAAGMYYYQLTSSVHHAVRIMTVE